MNPVVSHPRLDARPPLLAVRELRMRYPLRRNAFGRPSGWLPALAGVSFTLAAGETVGLVGESGCGKSTLARCVTRAIRPTGGAVVYQPAGGAPVDLVGLSERQLRPYRSRIRMVFQDPYTALNPRMNLRQIVGEPLAVHRLAAGSELVDRVEAMLHKVGLRSGDLHKFPRQLSGGERQRVNIARALITEPSVVVADEPVSALDVSVRAQILNLLSDLRGELGLTYLFISHDLSVVDHLCDRVLVMYLGSVVEEGPAQDLFGQPRHPYTEALLSAVPVPDPRLRRRGARVRLPDEVPDPSEAHEGCVFRSRCGYAQPVCAEQVPALWPAGPGTPAPSERAAACHFHDTLRLAGAALPQPLTLDREQT